MTARPRPSRPPGAVGSRPRADLLRDALAVLAALDATPRTLGDLSDRSGLPVWTVRRTLRGLAQAGAPVVEAEGPRPEGRGAPGRVYALRGEGRVIPLPCPGKRALGAPGAPGEASTTPPEALDALTAARNVAALAGSLLRLTGNLLDRSEFRGRARRAPTGKFAPTATRKFALDLHAKVVGAYVAAEVLCAWLIHQSECAP